jgi:hypothetical protein
MNLRRALVFVREPIGVEETGRHMIGLIEGDGNSRAELIE